ncbi:CaiB/BaiF CoA transferase family protein [Muricoccus pecuniae]|uniref:Crotonobetainyl-CoA:carnitine CoA-transferase CaiB-like acyl-CoA transferase n=1 Tax=Muricoccus pecuniae TaxID=693023 RepID=A0A840Y7W1_9PROT|nr:CoA transferase [Roseomonas pecuniae]MBB5696236.1 crotonobetainyl-CoA:carnitine CoA-transferase CaiB-like acyl-CoA transferase [Roseomonas pecuniae]
MKPLTGIKVLDMSRVLAGPLCAQALGDLGAEVIKVESLGLGDETRGWPPFKGKGLGAVFLCVNRNKRSIVVDLKTEKGQAVIHDLARRADVAIESFSTGVADKLQIDAPTLQSINPRLVHCSISGFGREGPLRQAPGYDVILQAFAGVMSMTGDEGGGYIRSPISPIDQMTGTHAIVGILAALMERGRTGKGGTVNVSLFDTAMSLQRYNLQSFWQTGVQPPKCGSSHESLCPYQAFEAADGAIMIGVANDNLWRKFCRIAGLDEIVDDPRFRTNTDRVAHRAETVERVGARIATQPVAFWYAELSKASVPCSPINTLAQLLDHPHTRSSDVVVEYEHPVAGPTRSVGQPYILDGGRRTAGSPPPTHGEHTQEILEELGLADSEIEALRAAKIVA